MYALLRRLFPVIRVELIVFLVATTCLHAEIYRRHVPGRYDFFSSDANWAATNTWFPMLDMANTGMWPHAAGDTAVIIPDGDDTNSLGSFQMYLNGDFTVGNLYCGTSNHCLFTAYNDYSSPLLFFVSTNGPVSRIVFTNMQPLSSAGDSRSCYMGFFQGITLVMSNDLHIFPATAANPGNTCRSRA